MVIIYTLFICPERKENIKRDMMEWAVIGVTNIQWLTCALDIGERMVICGAEIWRVEDSIRRICAAGGAERVDVFSITSSIIATVWMPGEDPLTQSRRILKKTTDLHQLDMLNDLSRRVCAEKPEWDSVKAELKAIDGEKRYPLWTEYAVFALVSATFSYLFGGHWQDCAAAGVIGLALRWLDLRMQKTGLNALVGNLLCSACCGVLAIFAVRLHLALSVDKIMIGNIMPLIPGVALTNALRDLFAGDLVSGLLRLIDALLLAASIALGFALAWAALGGLV